VRNTLKRFLQHKWGWGGRRKIPAKDLTTDPPNPLCRASVFVKKPAGYPQISAEALTADAPKLLQGN
jgi:hypothetical protein